MKIQTLFRLGALATMVTALGYTVGNLIYFFGTVDTISYIWLTFFVYTLEVFALIALFAAQVKRGDLFNFVGFVILLIGMIFYIIKNAGEMLIITRVLTAAQMDQAGQMSSFAALDLIAIWGFRVGSILFGYGIVRAGVFPRWAGILLLLVGVTDIFSNIPGVFYLVAVLLSVAWGWLGLALWNHSNTPE